MRKNQILSSIFENKDSEFYNSEISERSTLIGNFVTQMNQNEVSIFRKLFSTERQNSTEQQISDHLNK